MCEYVQAQILKELNEQDIGPYDALLADEVSDV